MGQRPTLSAFSEDSFVLPVEIFFVEHRESHINKLDTVSRVFPVPVSTFQKASIFHSRPLGQ